MATLAIQGHPTRGSEVIALLEMLGGINNWHYHGDAYNLYYMIEKDSNVIKIADDAILTKYTLEEFEEKYPYKVRDWVNIPEYESPVKISAIKWDGSSVQYEVFTDTEEWLGVLELKPYKEQISREEVMNSFLTVVSPSQNKGTLVEIDLTKKLRVADKVRIILGDYEVKEEDGETYLVKKKPKYPTTYEECCEVLKIGGVLELKNQVIVGWNIKLLSNLQQLLICRNAYWEIADGWKPDYKNKEQTKYAIANIGNNIAFERYGEYNAILAFPTEEMRDAFYTNFNDLIETVKELL